MLGWYWGWWEASTSDAPGRVGGMPWTVALLWGLSLVLLGIVLLVEPRLVAVLIAATLVAFGAAVMAAAALSGWRAWKGRPRRVPVRFSR